MLLLVEGVLSLIHLGFLLSNDLLRDELKRRNLSRILPLLTALLGDLFQLRMAAEKGT